MESIIKDPIGVHVSHLTIPPDSAVGENDRSMHTVKAILIRDIII